MSHQEPAIDRGVIDTLRQLNEEGQPDVVREVLGLFLANAPALVAAVAEAVARRDAAALQRSAHTLKGASGAIGATALQAACRHLEDLGKQQHLAAADAALAEMRREYARAEAAITQLL